MLRFLTLGMVCLTIASAAALYASTFRTRAIAHDLAKAERHLATLQRDVETLRAERAYLSRPERIAPLARQLGLVPADGTQFRALRDIERDARAGAARSTGTHLDDNRRDLAWRP